MPHYFDEQPGAATDPGEVVLDVGGRTLRLATDTGVFSRSRLDPGTTVLLRKAPPPPLIGTTLDLGCGYGPIALSLAVQSPDSTVWAVDVNEHARALVTENTAANAIDNVIVATPDDVPAGLTFDTIYSNPPIRIGKDALHALLDQWLRRLTPNRADETAGPPFRHAAGTPFRHGAGGRALPRRAAPPRCGLAAPLVAARRLPHRAFGIEQGLPRARRRRANRQVARRTDRVKQLRSVDLKRLHRAWQRRTGQRVALLLDGVQDPFNIGSIVRTAASMRVEHLYVCANSTPPTHPKVGRTSKGTERYLEWSEHEHTADGVQARAMTG